MRVRWLLLRQPQRMFRLKPELVWSPGFSLICMDFQYAWLKVRAVLIYYVIAKAIFEYMFMMSTPQSSLFALAPEKRAPRLILCMCIAQICHRSACR